jgi:hypothetical protein
MADRKFKSLGSHGMADRQFKSLGSRGMADSSKKDRTSSSNGLKNIWGSTVMQSKIRAFRTSETTM